MSIFSSMSGSPASRSSATMSFTSTQDIEIYHIISTLRDVLSSSFGPHGSAKIITNSCGAHMALTSSSKRLLSNLSLSHSFSKLVQAGIQQHLAVCADGGLFMGILMLSIIENDLKSGLPQQLCSDANEVLLEICVTILRESSIFCDFKLDIGNLKVMLGFVKGIIQTKPVCCLKINELDIISSLVLQAFLQVLPGEEEHSFILPDVEYKCIEGQPVSNSNIQSGVFIDIPDQYSLLQNNFKKIRDTFLRVALFSLSVTSDKTLFPEINIEGAVDVDKAEAIREQLSQLTERLVKLGVQLVCCQKVLHPFFKKVLRRKEILCLERLSVVHIEAVHRVTGGTLLASMDPESITPESLGDINNAKLVKICQKNFICLQSRRAKVCTIFLCHKNEDCLAELKHVFSVAFFSLGIAVSNPKVLPGAGCFEVWLAAKIRGKIRQIKQEDVDRIGCNKHQFISAAGCFIRSLEYVASSLHREVGATDGTYHHLWLKRHDLVEPQSFSEFPLRCACLMNRRTDSMDFRSIGHENDTVEDSPRDADSESMRDDVNLDGVVLDLAYVKENALKLAVEMANMVLKIGLIIHDKN